MPDPAEDFGGIIGTRRRRREVHDLGVARGGSRRGLSYELVWDAQARGSIGTLTLMVGGICVWGTEERGIHRDWSVLLEFLAERWNWLLLEQSYPGGVTPRWPSDLRSALLQMLPSLEPLDIEWLGKQFGQSHNLARFGRRAIRGRALPDIWVLREGGNMILDAKPVRIRWPFADVVRSLASLGEAIAGRLRELDPEHRIARAWDHRDIISDSIAQSISLGMTLREAEHLTTSGVIEQQSRSEILRDADELVAVARMVGSRASLSDLKLVSREVVGLASRSTDALDQLGRSANEFLENSPDLRRPHEQGHALAQWLRKELDVWRPGKDIDPDQLLEGWNVDIRAIQLTPAIEAISVWGPLRGPSVLVNRQGIHNRSLIHGDDIYGGLRATFAHELCHLLLDRGRSLPVAEVLGGSTPLYLEQRANAFAAEFLVPRLWAIQEYRRSPDAQSALDRVCSRYRVSTTLAARQLLNYSQEFGEVFPDVDLAILESIVARRI